MAPSVIPAIVSTTGILQVTQVLAILTEFVMFLLKNC
jgi:hypothetical protein